MGQITKEIHYSDQDSSNVTYWAKWVYDNKSRRLKEITGSYQNGKAVEQVSSESKYSEKSKYRTEKQEFYAGKLIKKAILVDSMAGIYTYHISYEFREDKTDRSGRRQGEEKMERSYETGNRRYENEVEYMVNGRLEAAEKIKTYYWLYDEKKRVIESGKIEYEEDYMNYIAQHPEELAYGVYSPRFVKDVLAGKVEGQKETFTSQSYDDMGRLTVKEHFRKKYSFKYNEKGQVTEQNNLSDRVTDVFTYNEQGLIIKMVSTTIRNGVTQHPSTAEYTYTFY